MKEKNIQIRQAFPPASRATAVTAYNGNETIGSAVGIPIGNSGRTIVGIGLGTISSSLTSVTYSVWASVKSTGNSAGDLVEITGASAVVTGATTDAKKSIEVSHKAISGISSNDPVYLFVKRVQVGAYAILDNVDCILTEYAVEPVAVNA